MRFSPHLAHDYPWPEWNSAFKVPIQTPRQSSICWSFSRVFTTERAARETTQVGSPTCGETDLSPSPSEIFTQRSCNFRLQPQKLWSGKTKLLQNRRSKCGLTLWWGIYSNTFNCSMWYSWQFLSIRKVVWIWIFSPVMGSWVCAMMTGKAEPTVNKMSQL